MAPQFHQALSLSTSSDEASLALVRAGFVVDYVEDHDGRRLGAVRLGGVRLIDNVPLRGVS
jgi:pantoate--beta-alanine ligase